MSFAEIKPATTFLFYCDSCNETHSPDEVTDECDLQLFLLKSEVDEERHLRSAWAKQLAEKINLIISTEREHYGKHKFMEDALASVTEELLHQAQIDEGDE